MCGGKIRKIQADWTGKHLEQKYTVPDLEYYICELCCESIYPPEAIRKIELYSPAFKVTKPVG